LLPPGTFKALKGHREGIVIVVSAVVAFGAIEVGVPAWAAVLIFLIAMLAYHARCSARERHEAALKAEETSKAAIAVGEVRARYGDLIESRQTELPLTRGRVLRSGRGSAGGDK
jgi:hypothetical protein